MIKFYDIFLFLRGDLRLRPDYYAILILTIVADE